MPYPSRSNRARKPEIKNQDVITFNINFHGSEYIKGVPFDLQMIDPNVLSSTKIYFSNIIEYSDKLLAAAEVPIKASTFTTPVQFLKLVKYGLAAMRLKSHKNSPTSASANQTKELVNSNIEYMTNLIFKKTEPIVLKDKKFIISRVQTKPGSTTTQHVGNGRTKFDKYVVHLTIDILSGTHKLGWSDYERMSCNDKRANIVSDFRDLFSLDKQKKVTPKYKTYRNFRPQIETNRTGSSRGIGKGSNEERMLISKNTDILMDVYRRNSQETTSGKMRMDLDGFRDLMRDAGLVRTSGPYGHQLTQTDIDNAFVDSLDSPQKHTTPDGTPGITPGSRADQGEMSFMEFIEALRRISMRKWNVRSIKPALLAVVKWGDERAARDRRRRRRNNRRLRGGYRSRKKPAGCRYNTKKHYTKKHYTKSSKRSSGTHKCIRRASIGKNTRRKR